MLFSTQQHRDNAVIPNRDSSVDRTAVIALCGALEFRCDMNGQAADRSMRCPPPNSLLSSIYTPPLGSLFLPFCSPQFTRLSEARHLFVSSPNPQATPFTHSSHTNPPPRKLKGSSRKTIKTAQQGGSLCVCSCACICQSRELLRLTKSISPGCTSVTHNS